MHLNNKFKINGLYFFCTENVRRQSYIINLKGKIALILIILLPSVDLIQTYSGKILRIKIYSLIMKSKERKV